MDPKKKKNCRNNRHPHHGERWLRDGATILLNTICEFEAAAAGNRLSVLNVGPIKTTLAGFVAFSKSIRLLYYSCFFNIQCFLQLVLLQVLVLIVLLPLHD